MKKSADSNGIVTRGKLIKWMHFVALAFLAMVAGAGAQVTPIGEFQGALHDSFEADQPGYLSWHQSPPLSVCDGHGMMDGGDFSIFDPGVWNFLLGDNSTTAPAACAAPEDGVHGLALEHYPHPWITNTFDGPINFFGAWWGVTSFDGPGNLTVMLFDASDQLIGAPQVVSYYRPSGDGALEWHGWHSSIPIKRVVVTSSSSTVALDNLQAGTPSGLQPVLKLKALDNGGTLLSGAGIPATSYQVEANSDLTTTNWAVIGNVTADQFGALNFTDLESTNYPARFYRLEGN